MKALFQYLKRKEIIHLKCKIAGMEKRLERLCWATENVTIINGGGMIFQDIIDTEQSLAETMKELELISQ